MCVCWENMRQWMAVESMQGGQQKKEKNRVKDDEKKEGGTGIGCTKWMGAPGQTDELKGVWRVLSAGPKGHCSSLDPALTVRFNMLYAPSSQTHKAFEC